MCSSDLVITGVWFWTSSPRADAAPPQTVAARKAEPLPAPARLAPKDDVETTAALSKPAPAPAPVPAAQPARSAACANPDALGVSRVVEILRGELEAAMMLAGAADVRCIDRSVLWEP